jgi:hypothetical protein
MAVKCSFPGCPRFCDKEKKFCVGHLSYAGVDLSDPKPKVLPAKSSKRKIDEKEYRKKAKAYLKAKPKCAGNFTGCTKAATTIHHKEGRTGANYLNERTWIGLCMNCHQIVELNPATAKEKGLSETRIK